MSDNFRNFTNNQQMIARMRKLAQKSNTTTQVILEEYTLWKELYVAVYA